MQFFFPIIASDHTYVIYINAKAGIDIIDNSSVDVANDMKYGTIPVDLVRTKRHLKVISIHYFNF